jgi:hypothetical protein
MKVTRKENSVMTFIGISEAFSFYPPLTLSQRKRSVPKASNAEIDLFKHMVQSGACDCGETIIGNRRKRYTNASLRPKASDNRIFQAVSRNQIDNQKAAKVWIKENDQAIQVIVGWALADQTGGLKKVSFRGYWENARKALSSTNFNNNYSRVVSRHIMKSVPVLNGFFRVRR